MAKITEVSHTTESGAGAWFALGMLTGGIGFMLPIEDSHKVIVESGGQLAEGHGATHNAARTDAVNNLKK